MKRPMTMILLIAALVTAVAAAGPAHASDGDVETLTAPDGTTVVIYRDRYGVPHVRAATETGAFFGQGVAVAEDRLFQMETFRRAATGRLSEVGLGDAATDRQIRTVFYTEAERRHPLAALPPEIRNMITSYVAGVNDAIGRMVQNPQRDLPAQFLALGFEPEPWTETQVAAVIQFFMRRFGQYGGEELQRAVELQTKGPAWFEANRPINDPAAPTTIAATSPAATAVLHAARPRRARLGDDARRAVDPGFVAAWQETDQRVEADLAAAGLPPKLGSFAVLVAGRKSASGHVLLLGAPQLVPPEQGETNIVHEVELVCPTLHVGGMAIGGIPGVIIGRTGHHAWTLTSGNSDNTDTFVEVLDATGTQYLHDGAYRPFEVVPEPDLGFAHYRTVHGPVVGLDASRGQAYAWQMTFWDRELQMAEAFYDMWKATGTEAFAAAVAKVPVNFNVFYAGRDQRVRYWHTGLLLEDIQTLDGPDPRLPRLGTGAEEWGSDPFLPFERLPQSGGEVQDYFVNWNNKPAAWWNNGDNVPWSLGFRPERTLRVLQIDDVVRPRTPFSFRDLMGVPRRIDTTGTYQQAVELADHPDGDRQFNIVPPGQSGFVSAVTGPSPHLADQWPLHEAFAFKPMVFDTPVRLWPPNHGYRRVDVTDFVDPSVVDAAARIAAVWSDEPYDDGGRGRRTRADVLLTGGDAVLLRAERSGGGNGRVYTVHVEALDAVGRWGTAALFQVQVPANRGRGAVALDDGPAYMVTPDGTTTAPGPDTDVPPARAGVDDVVLAQNSPNPFNPATTIGFSLPARERVELEVYDMLGRRVAVLVSGPVPAGRHEVRWDAGDLPSGLYAYRLRAGAREKVRLMQLVK